MADWVSAVAAVIAVGISFFALFVSWSSANTAERANDIQLHVYRKELYSAFYDLYIRFRTEGQFMKHENVFEFQPFSKTSYLYVSDSLHKGIDEFYINCRKLSVTNESMNWLSGEITKYRKSGYTEEELKSTIQSFNEQREDIKQLMEVTIPLSIRVHDELKEEIRLDKAPQGIWQRIKEVYNDPFPWEDQQEPQ